VLALWLSIQATHLGGNGGVSGTRVVPGETARLLYKNLEDTKMYENEELEQSLQHTKTGPNFVSTGAYGTQKTKNKTQNRRKIAKIEPKFV
jgi:hypothetical protein